MLPSSNSEALPLLSTNESTCSNEQSGQKENRYLIGGAYIILGAALYATMDFLVRLSTTELSIPPDGVLFVRSVIQVVCAGTYCLVKVPLSTLQTYSRRQHIAIFMYGIAMAPFHLFLFRALGMLPVGDVTAIMFTNPMFTILFSMIFLSEPFRLIHIIVVSTGSLGIYLITNPSMQLFSDSSHLIGYLYAISTTVLSALSYILVRYTGDNSSPMFVVFIQGIFIFLISMVSGGSMTIHELLSYGPKGVIVVVSSSVISIFLSTFIVKGFQLCPAGPGAILNTIAVPVAYIEGALFLNEVPTLKQIIGAVIVVSGTFVVGIDLLKKDKEIIMEEKKSFNDVPEECP